MHSEDKQKYSGLKVSKTNYLKETIEAIETVTPPSKEKRLGSSSAKMRARITHHSPSGPLPKEKSSLIPKNLEKLYVGQSLISEKQSSEAIFQKCKLRPSSNKKKTAINQNPIKSQKKAIALHQGLACAECKKSFKQDKSEACHFCGKEEKGVMLNIEIRSVPNCVNKVALLIGNHDEIVNIGEKIDFFVILSEKKAEDARALQTLDVNTDWTFSDINLMTPSFNHDSNEGSRDVYNCIEASQNYKVSFAKLDKEFAKADGFMSELINYSFPKIAEISFEGYAGIINDFTEKYCNAIEEVKKMVKNADWNYISKLAQSFEHFTENTKKMYYKISKVMKKGERFTWKLNNFKGMSQKS